MTTIAQVEAIRDAAKNVFLSNILKLQRSKIEVDVVAKNYLRAHGTSKEEFSAFFIAQGIYNWETKHGGVRKVGRIQFSIRGNKYKLYNVKFWTQVHILRSNNSTCTWLSIARMLLENCQDLERAATVCKEFFDKLDSCEPRLFLDLAFERYKSKIMETSKAMTLAPPIQNHEYESTFYVFNPGTNTLTHLPCVTNTYSSLPSGSMDFSNRSG